MSQSSCPWVGQCGGCDFISLPYQESLARKQRMITSLFSPFGEVAPILGMEHPLYYRNKVHRVFSRDARGRFHCGNYRAGTHYVVDVDYCLIEDRSAQRILSVIRDLARSFRIPIYDEDRGTGLLRHALVRASRTGGGYLAVLVMSRPSFPGKNHLIEAFRAACPEVTSLVLNLNDRHTTMVLGKKSIPLYGPGFIQDQLCGLTFRLSPGSFYQINPVQTEKLYSLAVDFAGLTGQETVLDAYCGIGTIGLTASSRAARVLGVELNPDAVRDARLNASINHIVNAEFFQGDAGDFMRSMAAQSAPPDVVFLDPPRSGSSETFLRSCVTAAPQTIVYVSCGPDSLRRDLAFLTSHNYRVQIIQPIDMFPFTEHVETVVLMSRVDR